MPDVRGNGSLRKILCIQPKKEFLIAFNCEGIQWIRSKLTDIQTDRITITDNSMVRASGKLPGTQKGKESIIYRNQDLSSSCTSTRLLKALINISLFSKLFRLNCTPKSPENCGHIPTIGVEKTGNRRHDLLSYPFMFIFHG